MSNMRSLTKSNCVLNLKVALTAHNEQIWYQSCVLLKPLRNVFVVRTQNQWQMFLLNQLNFSNAHPGLNPPQNMRRIYQNSCRRCLVNTCCGQHCNLMTQNTCKQQLVYVHVLPSVWSMQPIIFTQLISSNYPLLQDAWLIFIHLQKDHCIK